MTFGFVIADLQLPKNGFSVPAKFGTWKFEKTSWYDNIVPELAKGQCGNTFNAFNEAVTSSMSDADFVAVCEDLRNLCLLLSFMNATCVTPTGSTQYSVPQFIALGDSFVPARAIRGFPELQPTNSITSFLTKGLSGFSSSQSHYLRLLMTHWISGLTCYTLEDLFLAICVLLDIVKQIEISISGKQLTYAQGMTDSSNRLGISLLQGAVTKMRNDLVHEGRLSGSNFSNRTKSDCAQVIANALNWLDEYLIATLGVSGDVKGMPRWKVNEVEHYLPAFSLVP
jgi:hypothetical protein